MTKKAKLTIPGFMLRLEGTAVLLAAIIAYAQLGYSWWVFVLLLLWPDIAIVFYALNKNLGSMVYNLLHTLVSPLILLGLSISLSWPLGIQFALIWFAHIGMDRLFGYGLKYPGEFKETHLNRV